MLAPGAFRLLARGYAIRRMPTVTDIRHANLLRLLEEFDDKVGKFAEQVERDPSQISQLKHRHRHSASDKTRDIGDDLARWIELKTAASRSAGWGAMLSAIRDCEDARKRGTG